MGLEKSHVDLLYYHMEDISTISDLLNLLISYSREQRASVKEYNNILERWSMGRNGKLELKQDTFTRLKKEEKHELVIKKSKALEKLLSPDVLHVLLSDIEEIIGVSERTSEEQNSLLESIKKSWQKILEQNEHDSYHFGKSFKLTTHFGIGFLFYAAMKSDGNIDKSEFIQIRRNLSDWDNKTARLIVESINFAEKAIAQGSFFNTFSFVDPTVDLAKEEHELLIHIITYLKIELPVSLRVFVFKQIMAIIKADGQITEGERGIRKLLLSSWNDIEELV